MAVSMTMDEKLDAILFFIQEKTKLKASINKAYIWNLYVERTPELGIDALLFSDILQHLIDDKYLTLNNDTYHLTVKGRTFKGYVEYNMWYRKLLRNPIAQAAVGGLIVALIIWAITYLMGEGKQP